MNPDEATEQNPVTNLPSPDLMYSTDESIEGIAIRALVEIARWSKENNEIVPGDVESRIAAAQSILEWVQYREEFAEKTFHRSATATIMENLNKLTSR